MPTTGPWSISTITSGAALVPLENLINSIVQNVANALAAAKTVQAVANAAARDAKFPSPATGDRVYRLDTAMEQEYRGGAWKNRPYGMRGAMLYKNVAQSVVASQVALTWNSTGAQYDTDSMYSTGANTRLTVPTGMQGMWEINYHVRSNGVVGSQAFVVVNGTVIHPGGSADIGGTGAATNMAGNVTLQLAAGDYVEIQVLAASASGVWVTSNVGANWFSMRYLGEI